MYRGFQRVALAVVSWLATVRSEDAWLEEAVVVREGIAREEVGLLEAVVKVPSGMPPPKRVRRLMSW